jgi:hypothetical protein
MFSYIQNPLLKSYLVKRLEEPTVILCFVVLLEFYLQNPPKLTATKSEVEKAFNKKIRDFGINTFRRDYLKRQSGDPRNAIDESGSQSFFLRKEFRKGLDPDVSKRILNDIYEHYSERRASSKQLLQRLEFLASAPQQKQRVYISDFLKDEISGNLRGQYFEITTFAILKVYFESFGFLLNRFSTTFANDGGMDFVGQQGIYQVAVNMNEKKFNEDIIKTPNIQRVIVFKELVKNFDVTLFSHPLILRVVDMPMLESILDDLCKIEHQAYLKRIINTITHELSRESI